MSPLDLLTIVFIVLKLCGVIAWSWWWVLAPTWIGLLVIGILIIIYGFVYLRIVGGKRV